jgi:hypothetical protein
VERKEDCQVSLLFFFFLFFIHIINLIHLVCAFLVFFLKQGIFGGIIECNWIALVYNILRS